MRITVQPTDTTKPPVSLTGLAPEEFVEGLDGPHDWLGGGVPLVEGDELKQEDNGNASDTLNFRVSRSHASAAVAAQFYTDHPSTVPHLGRVTLEIVDDSGHVVARRKIEAAAIRVAREGWSVCGTVMTYRIEGGLITNN